MELFTNKQSNNKIEQIVQNSISSVININITGWSNFQQTVQVLNSCSHTWILITGSFEMKV